MLTTKVRSLSYYVAKACNGSLTNLIKSGFPPQKGKGQPVRPPAQPQGLTVSHGPQLSQLVAKVGPTFGAVFYNYRLTTNTPGRCRWSCRTRRPPTRSPAWLPA